MAKEISKANGGFTTEGLPDWMVQIRRAVTDAIRPDDLKEIFAKQVELAKGGDRKAIKFVFDQARAFSDLKGLTLIQNNYAAGDRPDDPSDAVPGSKEKLDVIRKRVASGNGAFDKRDRADVDLS